ncbi:MAG: (2Fe-2S)-binding protein [Thermoanaerobaculia bacterium]|nr:(2Fe-2S)-binding protein [Thermoanaerobaculia bacterium]
MSERILTINGRRHSVDADGDMPLLWVLRDRLGLTGTKYGCGEGICGSCTILRGSEPVRACQITLAQSAGGSFTTIEGLSADGDDPIQRAWLDEDVSQCGYCQPGMIMELKALLKRGTKISEDDIHGALSDHVCRCGSYFRIRKAALRAAKAGGAR